MKNYAQKHISSLIFSMGFVIALLLLVILGNGVVGALGAMAPDNKDFSTGSAVYAEVARSGAATQLEAPTSQIKIYSTTSSPTVIIYDPNQCSSGIDYTSAAVTSSYTSTFTFTGQGTNPVKVNEWGTYTKRNTISCANNEWRLKLASVPKSQEVGINYLYEATLTVTMPVLNGAVNAFKVEVPGGTAAFGTLGTAKFALQDRISNDNSYSDFNLEFGMPCSYTSATQVAFKWFDDDNGLGAAGNQNPDLYFYVEAQKKSGGGWSRIYPDTGSAGPGQYNYLANGNFRPTAGNNQSGSVRYTLSPDYRYNWVWKGVQKTNGIQFDMPFGPIYSKVNCDWSLAGTTKADQTTVPVGQKATFRHSVINQGTGDPHYDWEIYSTWSSSNKTGAAGSGGALRTNNDTTGSTSGKGRESDIKSVANRTTAFASDKVGQYYCQYIKFSPKSAQSNASGASKWDCVRVTAAPWSLSAVTTVEGKTWSLGDSVKFTHTISKTGSAATYDWVIYGKWSATDIKNGSRDGFGVRQKGEINGTTMSARSFTDSVNPSKIEKPWYCEYIRMTPQASDKTDAGYSQVVCKEITAPGATIRGAVLNDNGDKTPVYTGTAISKVQLNAGGPVSTANPDMARYTFTTSGSKAVIFTAGAGFIVKGSLYCLDSATTCTNEALSNAVKNNSYSGLNYLAAAASATSQTRTITPVTGQNYVFRWIIMSAIPSCAPVGSLKASPALLDTGTSSFTTTVYVSFASSAAAQTMFNSATTKYRVYLTNSAGTTVTSPAGVPVGGVVKSTTGAGPGKVTAVLANSTITFTYTFGSAVSTAGIYNVRYDMINTALGLASVGGGNCTEKVSFANKPYFAVRNGDIQVGVGMPAPDRPDIACEQNSNAGVVGWNQGVDPYTGASTNYAVLALNAIQSFATSILNTSSANRGAGLSFANTGDSNIDTVLNSSAVYGGYYGSYLDSCMYDYYGGRPADDDPTFTQMQGSTLPEKSGTYYLTGTNISTSKLLPGTHLVIYAENSIYIQGNITFSTPEDSVYKNLADIPSLWIITKGNIYVDPSVSQLSGTYVAQGRAVSDAVENIEPDSGVIYTCGKLNQPLYRYEECGPSASPKLTVVAGSFIARKITLNRSWGTISNIGTGAAEAFRYSPLMWLAPSSIGGETEGTLGKYQSITSLPPVL